MGVRTTIGELDYEITQYSVSEDSTPTAITDSSGGVGEVSFTIKKPSDTKEFPFTPDAFGNPGWTTGGNIAPRRENYAFAPQGIDATDYGSVFGWGTYGDGEGGPVGVSDAPAGVTTAYQTRVLTPGSGISYNSGYHTSEDGKMELSFWVRASGAQGDIEFFVHPASTPDPVPADGNWHRVTVLIEPETSDYVSARATLQSTGTLQMSGVLLEDYNYDAPPVFGPFFDGSFPTTPTGEEFSWYPNGESTERNVIPSLVTPTQIGGAFRVLRNGVYFLNTEVNTLLSVPGPTRVSILAVNAGQTASLAGNSATSTEPNQMLTLTGTGTLDLGPGLWGAPRFEVEGTTVYRQHPVNEYTEGWLKRQPFRLADSRYGFTVGEVVSTSYQQETQDIAITARTRTADLNIFDIQAEPFIGTLGQAFLYYASLAGLNADVSVDASITNTPIKVPGFHGELWPRLKELAAANQCEIALVAGVIYLRPLRQQEIVRGRDFSRNRTIGDTQLAQAVEVYLYDSYELDGDLFYPPGGWSPEVEVLNVNAGETAEYTLEFDASLTRFSEPTMVDFVSREHSSSSVYTIVADDGLPVPPAQWRAAGGKVEFVLNPDTSSITVTLTGPENIRIVGGETSRTFSLALASDRSGSRYSTLRIVGYGVGYHKTKHTFITGLPSSVTSTEVGVTIDNRFVNDYQTLNRVGVEAAKQFAGGIMSINGTVSTVTGRGTAQPRPSYQDVIDDLGSMTYAEARTHYTSVLNLTSYQNVVDYWLSQMSDLFESQIFGRVQGARVWSKETRRWYRVRQASITPENISFSNAEDDLNYQDMVDVRGTMTYADVVEVMQAGNLTYSQERMAGAYNGIN